MNRNKVKNNKYGSKNLVYKIMYTPIKILCIIMIHVIESTKCFSEPSEHCNYIHLNISNSETHKNHT